MLLWVWFLVGVLWFGGVNVNTDGGCDLLGGGGEAGMHLVPTVPAAAAAPLGELRGYLTGPVTSFMCTCGGICWV